MNKYRIASIGIMVFLLLPLLIWLVKQILPGGCNRVCPNRNFFGCTVKDVPRPMPNPPCPGAPACPACPNIPACPACPNVNAPVCPACPVCPVCPDVSAPPATTTPPVILDHSTQNTDLTDCQSTVVLPPSPGGLSGVGTSCFVPGKELVVDVMDGPSCINNGRPITISLLNDLEDQSYLINIFPDHTEAWFGGHLYPPNQQSSTPLNPPLDFSKVPIQVVYKLVSDTEIDVYFQGNLIGIFPKPSFPIAKVAFAGCEWTDNYCKFQNIS